MAAEGPGPDPPPTLVFDLDGTLVDTAEDLIATLNVILAGEGLARISLADGKAMIGHGVRVTIERAFAGDGRALDAAGLDRLTAEFLVRYTEHMIDQSRPFPGAEAAIKRFATAGWQLAVCTNKHAAIARRLLELLGMADRFAAICGPDTFGFRKPDPRHLTGTIRAAGGSPQRAVLVGDSLTDVDTAIAAAIPVVAVSFGYSPIPVRELGASRTIDDFSALWDAVASLDIGHRPIASPRTSQ